MGTYTQLVSILRALVSSPYQGVSVWYLRVSDDGFPSLKSLCLQIE